MIKKAGSPILPRSVTDPTGIDTQERQAFKAIYARLRECVDFYKNALSLIPVYKVSVNSKYEYRIDATFFNAIISGASLEVDAELLEGGDSNLWFFNQFIVNAYSKGTAQEFANLSNQSAAYKAGRGSLAEILRSEPYRRRIALIRSRVFEEMRKLSADVKTDMARILTDGIARGKNPLEVARNLTENLKIEEVRAKRIARSEMTTALRRARMDESDEATESFALNMKQMQISALSPTTRKSHAARHGKLYSTDQMRDWWSENGNSVNCKCSTVSVLVDSEGNPLVPAIIDRAEKNRAIMEKRGYRWSED